MCYCIILDCEAMERGIFGNLEKVLNQPHGSSTGDQLDDFPIAKMRIVCLLDKLQRECLNVDYLFCIGFFLFLFFNILLNPFYNLLIVEVFLRSYIMCIRHGLTYSESKILMFYLVLYLLCNLLM